MSTVDVVVTMGTDDAAEFLIDALFEICTDWEKALVDDEVDKAEVIAERAASTRSTIEELFSADEKVATKFGPDFDEVVRRFPFLED